MLLLPPQDKWTALSIAVQEGHKDVAELLLERNADVNSVTGPVSADGCAGGGREGGWGGGRLLCFIFGCWSMCVKKMMLFIDT